MVQSVNAKEARETKATQEAKKVVHSTGMTELSVDEATAMEAMSHTAQPIIAVMRALGDEVRIAIVRKLVKENHKLRSEEILACASVMALSQPCMSYHFAKLVKAGVVLQEKQGTEKVYTLNAAYLSDLGLDVNKL